MNNDHRSPSANRDPLTGAVGTPPMDTGIGSVCASANQGYLDFWLHSLNSQVIELLGGHTQALRGGRLPNRDIT